MNSTSHGSGAFCHYCEHPKTGDRDARGNDALHPEHPERGSCSIHSSMTVFFDSSSKTAFFKLQSPVALLVPSSQTDRYDAVRSNMHLCIRPEHIISLVLYMTDQNSQKDLLHYIRRLQAKKQYGYNSRSLNLRNGSSQASKL